MQAGLSITPTKRKLTAIITSQQDIPPQPIAQPFKPRKNAQEPKLSNLQHLWYLHVQIEEEPAMLLIQMVSFTMIIYRVLWFLVTTQKVPM